MNLLLIDDLKTLEQCGINTNEIQNIEVSDEGEYVRIELRTLDGFEYCIELSYENLIML